VGNLFEKRLPHTPPKTFIKKVLEGVGELLA
jgi:hypothetical protein